MTKLNHFFNKIITFFAFKTKLITEKEYFSNIHKDLNKEIYILSIKNIKYNKKLLVLIKRILLNLKKTNYILKEKEQEMLINLYPNIKEILENLSNKQTKNINLENENKKTTRLTYFENLCKTRIINSNENEITAILEKKKFLVEKYNQLIDSDRELIKDTTKTQAEKLDLYKINTDIADQIDKMLSYYDSLLEILNEEINNLKS